MDEYIGKLYSFATIIESFDFIFNWNEFHFFLCVCRFDRSINADVSLSNRRRTQLAFFVKIYSGPLSTRQLPWRADNGPL